VIGERKIYMNIDLRHKTFKLFFFYVRVLRSSILCLLYYHIFGVNDIIY